MVINFWFIIPAHSSVLRYNGTWQPLNGIDGIYVINLDRRPDRLQSFKERSGLGDADFHRFSAVDGKAIKSWTPELDRLFKNNKFGSSATRIGATKSHAVNSLCDCQQGAP